MSLKRTKPAFMSGIDYLDRQQYYGESWGGMRMINRRFEFSKSLYSKDLYAHYGCVNAIEFSNDGEWLVSGGDDKRVLIWNVDKTLAGSYQPKAMKGEHNSNIFCLGFSSSHTKLFSAGNDEQVILHDVNTTDVLDVFLHNEAVYGLSVDPVNENVFASACDDGRVLIWDIRQSSDPFMLAGCHSAYHAVMYNPTEPRFIATANARDGVCLWDMRKPRICLMKYGGTLLSQSAMSVRFNSTGTHLLALRRRLPPVLYEITSVMPAAEFDHQEYYNSCTMKSCCFAGERDQYVLSGSDDFKLYVWQIPDAANTKKGIWVNKAHLILRGHRSIVNQVRYNNTYGILASSGVEKIVKIWSSFPVSVNDGTNGYITNKDFLRKVYSHEEYINLVLESGQFMTHDYSHHSVQEDPRMMAFFDSLVQRDIEGWTSDSSDAADLLNTCFEVQTSNSVTQSSSTSSSDDDIQPPMAQNNKDRTDTSSRSENMHSPVSMNLSYKAQKTLKTSHSNKSPSNTEEKIDASLDRISQLIAQKRREQMMKSAKATLKLSKKNCKIVRKRIRLLKKRMTHDSTLISGSMSLDSSENVATVNGCDSNSNEAKKTLRILLKAKDKRKLLRKKRAKLSKDSALVANSSDTDESDKEVHAVVSSTNKSEEDDENSNSAKLIVEENDTVDVNNTSVHKRDNPSLDTVLSNSTSNGLNGAEPAAVAANSNSLVFFPTKSEKRNNRNYRKRSADEVDEE